MRNQPQVICPPRFWDSKSFWDAAWLLDLAALMSGPEGEEMAAIATTVQIQGFITDEQKWELNDIYIRSIADVFPYLP